MIWRFSYRADPDVVPIADRHYNRQKIGAPQFVPPGRCLVLRIGTKEQLATEGAGGAYWVTSWPFQEYAKHAWAGAWICSAFRNEGAGRSSVLIRDAVAITRWHWQHLYHKQPVDVPKLGMVTFIDPTKVRVKPNPGKCFLKAGFSRAICPKHESYFDADCAACLGLTDSGLIALQLLPAAMPQTELPIGGQMRL